MGSKEAKTLITLPIEKVKTYEKNHKKHPEAQLKLLMENIEKFGFDVPILVDKNHVIIAGHARYEAMCRLGEKEILCMIRDDLSEKEVRARRIADNRIGEKGSYDKEILAEELKAIFDDDEEMFNLTGFKVKDMNFEIEDLDIEIEEKEEEKPNKRLMVQCPECGHEFKIAKG